MKKYKVNWINDGRVVPVQSISLNNTGIPIPKFHNPAEEIFLFCASDRLSHLSRENPNLEFTIECITQPDYEHYSVGKKVDPQNYLNVKIDEANQLIPIRVVDDEHFTLEQASRMMSKMVSAFPDEVFEIFVETYSAARLLEP